MSLEHYSIVFDREPNGVHTAYVASLPVYAAADTCVQCERGFVEALNLDESIRIGVSES